MSEELENSLQQAVETYLNERLRTIDEQIDRLRTELNEAVARLHEVSRAEPLNGTALSAAIFAHLQTARGQKLSGATFSSPAGDTAQSLKRAVTDIESQNSQAEILKALLRGSAEFAERVALFVVKNGQAIGWRASGAHNRGDLQMIGGVSLPLSAEASLTKAVHAQAPWTGAARSNTEDDLLLDQLGGNPELAAVIPLTVRGKVVAALYADSAAADQAAINADALEVLARVAAMAVNLASIQRGAAATRPVEAAATPPERVEVEQEAAYQPHVEPPPAEIPAPVAEPAAEAIEEPSPQEAAYTAEPPSQPEAAAETQPEIVAAEAVPEIETAAEPAAETTVESVSPAAPAPAESNLTATTTPAEPMAPPAAPAEPAFASHYSTPLGGTRRYGVTEPDLPIEVGDDERRLHNDARRYARLLVSEIKLYNENKVKEGRSNSDLYDRLREDIDRSRQMYDKRVARPVAARHDYFHQELVNLLAEGDAAKLGQSYPGAIVSV